MATEKKMLGGFQVDRKLLERTDKLAVRTERSRAAIIRLALKEYLERREKMQAS